MCKDLILAESFHMRLCSIARLAISRVKNYYLMNSLDTTSGATK